MSSTITHTARAALLMSMVCLVQPAIGQDGEKKGPVVTYVDDVMPILRQNCFTCHNPDKKSGDLDLTNYTNVMQGGASGTVIEPGDSGSSYLYMLVTHQTEPSMPPESPKLADELLETIRKWIDGGVLETKTSSARIKKKKTVDFALEGNSNERPETVPLPARLSLQPVTHTETTTAVTALATSPWAPLVAVAGQEQVLVYNTQTLELCAVLPFPEGVPQVLRFSRNGSLLLAGGGRGGASGRVVVWDVRSGERVMEVGDELDTVLAADISSDQTLIALGGPQRVVRIYSTETGELLHELRKHTDWICSLEFSPDSVLLATGDRSGGLYVWEAWTGREYLTLKAHTANVTGVSWRSDSNILASCSEDGSIRLWEMENGGEIKNWGAHGGGTSFVEFTRDGRVVSCGRDRTTKLWNQDGKLQREFEAFSDLALRVSYCDETNRVIAGDWTGAIRVWNAEDGAALGQLPSNPPPLVERRDAAARQLAEIQEKHGPLREALVAAEKELQRVRADAGAVEQLLAELKAASEASSARLSELVAQRDQHEQEHEKASRRVALFQEGIAALSKAVQSAEAAASKLPEDTELASAVAVIKGTLQARTAELESNQSVVEEHRRALEVAAAEIPVCQKECDRLAGAIAENQQRLENVRSQLPGVEAAVAEAQQAVAPVAAELAIAEKQLAHWNDEIAFAEQLAAMLAQRAEFMKQLSERETEYAERLDARDAAHAALQTTMQEFAAADKMASDMKAAFEQAVAEFESQRAALRDLESAHREAAARVQTLDAVVELLAQGVSNTAEAAKQGGDDKEVQDAAAKLQQLLDARKAAHAEALELVAAHAAEITRAQGRLVTLESAAAEAASARAAAEKLAAERAAAKQAAEAQLEAAQSAADAAEAAMAEVQKEIDRVGSELNALKGITTS